MEQVVKSENKSAVKERAFKVPKFNSGEHLLELQIISDLHIEFLRHSDKKIVLDPLAPVLCLLGDIGIASSKDLFEYYKSFLLKQSEEFEKVLVLLGNHEYYGSEYFEVQRKVKEFCDEHPTIILMQKNSILLNGIRILGTTLWSKVDSNEAVVQSSMNDYHKISITKEGSPNTRLRVSHTNEFFADERQWLEDEIRKAKEAGEKVVVLTHHSPILDGSDPKFTGSSINPAFCSDLEYMMGPPVVLWAYGHTHYVQDVMRNGTRVLTNAAGYPHTTEPQKCNWELVLKV